MTATTALTAQNTKGVYDVHHVPPEFVRKQIDACLEDIGADVIKTGMLSATCSMSFVEDLIDYPRALGELLGVVLCSAFLTMKCR